MLRQPVGVIDPALRMPKTGKPALILRPRKARQACRAFFLPEFHWPRTSLGRISLGSNFSENVICFTDCYGPIRFNEVVSWKAMKGEL